MIYVVVYVSAKENFVDLSFKSEVLLIITGDTLILRSLFMLFLYAFAR